METDYKLLWCEYVDPPLTNLINVDEFFENEIYEKFEYTAFAYDFETSGLDLKAECFWVRCVSFHNDNYSCSVQIRDEEGGQISAKHEEWLFEWLTYQEGTIAHNSTYECGVMMRATGKFVKPLADTFILAKALSNEGFLGQRWSLDFLAEHILDWLVYSKELDAHLKEKGLKKGDMCHADWEVLGWYNQLDSAATWEIYKICQIVIKDHWDTWGQYFMQTHQEDHMSLLELQVAAYDEGLTIDTEALESYNRGLVEDIRDRKTDFFTHPKIAEVMQIWHKKILSDYTELEPKERRNNNGELHGQYINSYKRWFDMKEQFIEDNEFSLDSPAQLRWLAYQIFDVYVQGDIAILKEKE